MAQTFYELTRPQKLFVVCAGVFITALVIAEAVSSKFFTAFYLPFPVYILGESFNRVTMTAGVLAFPITFIMTDIINEYFGKKGIRFVTLVGMGLVIFEFALIQWALWMPTDPISPAPDAAFRSVFGTSSRIIIGSLTAYLIGQLVDISLFFWLRKRTQGKFLWLRATGSTLGSQFFDTFIVLSVAFAGVQGFTFQTILAITLFNYGYKFFIALGITPLLYLVHWLIDRYLGKQASHDLIEQAGLETS